MLPILSLQKRARRVLRRDAFTGANGAALDTGIWTTQCGSWEINSNQARSKTTAVDGNNLIGNGEFTTDTTGWTAVSGATLTRRDFTSSPDIDPTGGTDNYGLEVAHGTAALGYGRYNPTTAPGATYTATCRAYSPSANTVTNGAMLFLQGGGATSIGASTEDVWQTLTVSLTPTAALDLRCYCQGTTIGDKAYFDAITLQRKAAIATCDPVSANVDISVKVTMPASGIIPMFIPARWQDATHYWMWRIRPGTAGTDFELVSVNGSTITVVASADVDWVAGQQYTLRLRHYDTQFAAYVDGTRTLIWTSTYLKTAHLFGLGDTGVANGKFDDWIVSASTDIGARGVSILADSIGTGPAEWPQLTIAQKDGWIEYNHAHNGYRIDFNLADEVVEAVNDAAHYVMIELGTNDSANLGGLQALYLASLQQLWSDHPTVIRIYCMGVLPKTTAGSRASVNTSISGAVAQAVALGIPATYWDTDVSLVNPGQAWIDPSTDTDDGLHPNAIGSPKIAAEVLARV